MIGTHGNPESYRRFHWFQMVIVVTGALLIVAPCTYSLDRKANEMSRKIEQKKKAVKQGKTLLQKAPALTSALKRAAAEQHKLAEKAKAEFLEACRRRFDSKRCEDLAKSVTKKTSARQREKRSTAKP
jgi:hypothetical protein